MNYTRQKESRWYVYTLTDPRDGSVFYVGKGCGKRIDQHEKDAANPQTVCSKKISKIRGLQSLGLNVGKEQLAFFWDEQAAYDFETDLIEEIGLANLTNVLPGGQKAWERRRLERETRRKKADPFHVALGRKSNEHLIARLSEWFKIGGHKGAKVRLTTTNPALTATVKLSEALYNNHFPWLWERIQADTQAFAVLRERIRPYGVEVAYGRS